MALHARLELPLAGELRRIGNGAASEIDVPLLDGVDVKAARTMAALAVDAFGHRLRKPRPVALVLERGARIGVVTGYAVFVDRPAKIHMSRAVVPGAHRPR